MEDPAPGVLFSGAFGAGKTIGLCAKGLKLSLDYPGNFGLLCRKTRNSMTHTTIKTWWDKICPRELVADYNKTEGLVKFHNGSGVIFGGLDDPEVDREELAAWSCHTSEGHLLRLFLGGHFYVEQSRPALLRVVSELLQPILDPR